MELLKSLLENNAITEELATTVQEAFDAKVKENRLSVTKQLREEFAQKYEHDKAQMAEAVESLITDSLAKEMAELHEDVKQLSKQKAKYAVGMRRNAALVREFVSKALAKEINELHEDQKLTAKKFSVLEEFVVDQLSGEIAEFQEDKKDLAKTKVRLVKESREHYQKMKTAFKQKMSVAISETVAKGLKREMLQLREDIEVARRNDFGRKIFEAFQSEYTSSYLNEKSDIAKLMTVIETKNKQLKQTKRLADKAFKLAEAKQFENKGLVESRKRENIISELVGPLSKDQKSIMIDLLESVQTNKLRSSFEKYLPAVIDGNSPAKQKAVITEGKEITGNRRDSSNNQTASENNVFDIKRLAGIN